MDDKWVVFEAEELPGEGLKVYSDRGVEFGSEGRAIEAAQEAVKASVEAGTPTAYAVVGLPSWTVCVSVSPRLIGGWN